ncbi:hypothetical protein FOC1_g10011765 [Fusarium oxysporum f. sp. cubense race 1]|uniref:Proteoglycan n=1 Tax=Fusarium oxysporum f. sp. cubense (strain race 1) TaxID=1229664 RepID=N4U0P9_FUSC1|nr:hypothetical protein FOC1_g10011765 [Fusarium oxysporum f. sp. cubense race 1]
MKLSKRLGAFWALSLSLLPSVLAASSCSQLSGRIYTGPNSNKFDILCDTSTVSGHIFAYYSEGDEFQDCVDRCDGDSTCIVALFLDGSGDFESSTSASSEATSTEATTSEAATSSEAATTEATSTETTSTEATSTEATSTEATSTEAHDPIHRQPQFLHYNQSIIRGFHFCALSYFNYFITIFFDDDSKPGFYINISAKLCYKPSSQVASSSGSSSSGTTEVGSKTLSTSGATIIKTTSESHLSTSNPTTDSIWTVYLTLVKYVTCTTGVVAETVTTATYVTVDSNDGSYGPPVVTMPDGCIGGYEVDASGHSYPIAQPTKGSHVNSPDGENSQPSVRPTLESPGNSPSGYETGQLHIPTPAAESQGSSQPEQGNKQPSALGQGSSEPNSGEPQPTQGDATQTAISAYQSGALVNPLLSSSIRQGQQGISTTFTTEASVTEEIQAPKSTHNHSSEAEGAPSASVTISGANRHQCMVWTLVTAALLGLGMLF